MFLLSVSLLFFCCADCYCLGCSVFLYSLICMLTSLCIIPVCTHHSKLCPLLYIYRSFQILPTTPISTHHSSLYPPFQFVLIIPVCAHHSCLFTPFQYVQAILICTHHSHLHFFIYQGVRESPQENWAIESLTKEKVISHFI